MKKELKDFIGYKVGDVITLSDIQTQEEFSKMSMDFPIREVKKYIEPNGVFQYTGYTVEAPDKSQYMILIKAMKEQFEIYIFFLDTGAALYKAGAGQEPCPLWCLLNEEQTETIKRFEADITSKSGPHHVTWDRQTISFGIDFMSTAGESGICTLGEYFTNDSNDGNNFCLIDWKGSADKGYIEVFYGCQIKDHEIVMYHK